MPNPFSALPLLLLLPLLSCGGADNPDSSKPSGTNQEQPTVFQTTDDSGSLQATSGDKTWQSKAKVANRGLSSKAEKLHLILQADQEESGHSMTVSVEKKGLETGEYPFVSRIRRADMDNDQIVLMMVQVSQASVSFTSKEGTLKLETLDTIKDDKGVHRVLRAIGTFEGTFSDSTGGEKVVTGSFDFSPE